MITIEDELRRLYADPPGARAVETRIIATFGDGSSGPAVLGAGSRPSRRTALNWAVAGATAATVASVAVGVAVLRDHEATQAPAAVDVPSSSPPVTSANHPAGPPEVTVTPQVIARTLIALLPREGTTSHLSGSYGLGSAGAQLVYDDGHGAAEVTVSLQFPYRYRGTTHPQGSGPLCITNPMPTQHCATRADGSQFSTYQGDANVPGGPTEWDVAVLRTDGVLVDVTEWNAAHEKDGTPTRREPPFTMAELAAIVQSPDWQASVPAATARRAAHLFTPERSGS